MALQMPILVLALNFEQYCTFCQANRLRRDELRFVHNYHTVQGYGRGVKFVVVGLFWDRTDAIEIWDYLKHYHGEELSYDEAVQEVRSRRTPKVVTKKWGDGVVC